MAGRALILIRELRGQNTFIVDILDNDAGNNTDTVMDFVNGTDFIQIQNNNIKLSAEQVASMLAGSDATVATVADNGVNTTFTFANGSFLIIKNTLKSALSVDDFVTMPIVVENSAPTGVASAVLAQGVEDVAYIVSAANLLEGFSDLNNDVLSVANLSTDHGSVVNNGNGTFTITPATNYNGILTLNYHVIDGNSGSITAIQSVNLSPTNDSPIGSPTFTLASGSEDVAYIVSAANLIEALVISMAIRCLLPI